MFRVIISATARGKGMRRTRLANNRVGEQRPATNNVGGSGMGIRPTVRRLSIVAAAFTTVSLSGLTLGLTPAMAGTCTAGGGTPVGANGYGACVTPGSTTILNGGPGWIGPFGGGVYNTPAVGPVPAQAFGLPYVPPEGYTLPPVVVQGVRVSPCLGGC